MGGTSVVHQKIISDHYTQNKQYSQAIEAWKKTLDIINLADLQNPPNNDTTLTSAMTADNEITLDKAVINFNIGKCFWELGRYPDAMEYYTNALEDEPDNFQYNLVVATNHVLMHNIEASLKFYKRCTQLQPESGIVWYYYGLALLESTPVTVWEGERIEEVKQCLDNAIRYEYETGKAHYALAGILNQQERKEESAVHLEKAKELGTDTHAKIKKRGEFLVWMIRSPKSGKNKPVALSVHTSSHKTMIELPQEPEYDEVTSKCALHYQYDFKIDTLARITKDRSEHFRL